LLAGLVSTVVGLGACGGEDEGQQVRAALVDLRFAYFAGDYGAVCSRLSTAAKRQLADMGHNPAGTCPHDMAERMSSAAPSRRDRLPLEIVEVDVDGDRATVTAELGGSSPSKLPLVKVDGRWKADALFGASGPPAVDMQ